MTKKLHSSANHSIHQIDSTPKNYHRNPLNSPAINSNPSFTFDHASFSTHCPRSLDILHLPPSPTQMPFGLIEKFSETRLNQNKSQAPEMLDPSATDMTDSRVMQRNRRARLLDIQKFQKKLRKIEDEMGKIRKKRGTLDEKERALKTKRVKLISKMRQRNFPVDNFNEVDEIKEYEWMGEEDLMEMRAVEKLVDLSRRMEY